VRSNTKDQGIFVRYFAPVTDALRRDSTYIGCFEEKSHTGLLTGIMCKKMNEEIDAHGKMRELRLYNATTTRLFFIAMAYAQKAAVVHRA